jgi:hypothetical protein
MVRPMQALPGEVTPLVRLNQLLDELRQIDTHLEGLGLNCSPIAFLHREADDRPRFKDYSDEYEAWITHKVQKLEAAIIQRVLAATAARREFWITSKQAVAIADTLGYNVAADRLSKACRQLPWAFTPIASCAENPYYGIL